MEANEREIKNIKKYIKLEKIMFTEKYENPDILDAEISPVTDLTLLATLWTGSFGRLSLAKHNVTGQIKTMKMINKQTLAKRRHYVNAECNVMAAIGTFPFTARLEWLAKDVEWLYLVMPMVTVGNLFEIINDQGQLDETTTRFYSAQIVLGVEFLHAAGLVHRNLRPDNVVVNVNGYVRLANFGMAKVIGRGRTYTLCGTPHYMAPEVVTMKGYGLAADYWSLGVTLYEMVAGRTPFSGPDPASVFDKVLTGAYRMVDSFSPMFQDLIAGTVQMDLSRRLGNLKNGIDDIKNHPWFSAINWLQIINQKLEAPYIPSIKHRSNDDKKTEFWTNKKEFSDF